jgi:ABC-type uncharacterized transport system permease subunit
VRVTTNHHKEIPTVLNVERLFFDVKLHCVIRLVVVFLGGTYQFGAKHFTEDSVHDVVL